MKSPKQSWRLALMPFVVLVVVSLCLKSLATGSNSNSEKKSDERKAKCERVVLDWLESQRKGRKGLEYWSKEWWVSPVRMYAVRSWDIVDRDEILHHKFTIRISSSTKGGIPIEKLWTIRVNTLETESFGICSVKETVEESS